MTEVVQAYQKKIRYFAQRIIRGGSEYTSNRRKNMDKHGKISSFF